VVSLAVLTKYTAWIVAAVAGFFLLAGWTRVEKAPPASIAKRLALLGALVLALSGWFYARNVIHFGQVFPLNVDLPGQTQQWWSQPGYYTPAFFLRFGAVLAHPYLAGFHTAWDSFYSTLWGDGQLAGQILARARHPYWDYELMAAGYWLALPAAVLLALGAARSLRLAFRDPDAGRRAAHSFLLTLAYTLLLSVLYMTLRQPDYGQAKAFYALAAIAPLSVFFALGCGAADSWLEERGAGWVRALLYGWLGAFSAVLLLSYAA
jgi:predicted membrane channel-forming protein YqfA (hemolysin III family)